MDRKLPLRPYLLSALFMSILGWVGLALLLNLTLPYLWPRWAFIALIVVGMTGLALLPAWFFNNRSAAPPVGGVVLRQALWFGVFGAMLAWLEMGRLLTFGMGLAIAGGIIVIEYLLRLRELAQKPTPIPPPDDSVQ